MIAFVTTIGEPTTDLCIWALKRNGFEVHTVSGDDSLAEKLKRIYEEAHSLDVDFIRVDADVIVNKNLTPEIDVDLDIWWAQFQVFNWYQQNLAYGGIQFIRKEALPVLVKRVDESMELERPETFMYRLEEFGNPRRCQSINEVVGIHGYGIKDIKSVRRTKQRRGQTANYDFELVEMMNRL